MLEYTALYKSAHDSATLDVAFAASLAVDVIYSLPDHWSCAVSEKGSYSHAWWKIDLHDEYIIKNIEIVGNKAYGSNLVSYFQTALTGKSSADIYINKYIQVQIGIFSVYDVALN